MNEKIYFFSDAHLAFDRTGAEKEKQAKLLDFLKFLEEKPDTGAVYVLGDLFDFWFEWYHVIPRYWFPVLHQFRKMADRGIAVHLITGNHDFYTGRYLEEEVGIRCFNESHEFISGGKWFFLAHGDGYAKNDRGYRFLKRIIRHPFSIFMYKTFVPADWGMQLARWTSRSSRKLVQIEKESWGEEYYRFALEKFKHGYDFVILGHIHVPMIRETNEGKKCVYVNCGDWSTRFSYACYDGEHLELKFWETQMNLTTNAGSPGVFNRE